MKKILVELNSGRLCDIVDPGSEFPVAPGLAWYDAPDNVNHTDFEFVGGAISKKQVDIETLKKQKRLQIESERDQQMYSDVAALGHMWQADKRSRDLLNAAINLAHAGLPLPQVWRTSDNIDVQITSLSDLLAIAGAMATQTQTAYFRSWERKAALEMASTPEEIEAV